jgi:hypothetical protein
MPLQRADSGTVALRLAPSRGVRRGFDEVQGKGRDAS